jgi:hypothetical protein
MSLEFLSVFPEYRKSKLGLSLAQILMSLSLKSAIELKADAITGIARKELKVDVLCREFGCRSLVPTVKRGNLECEIIWYLPEDIKTHHDLQIERLSNSLWESRTYATDERLKQAS